ncbi:photosystem I assembly protein Ycf3 [Legionella steigerwaltii]|uniref:Photosystem I assembly protein Ycf3 n=1 Tax=Legionella steigerwaltii TaxID=460 RepID=A0A378LCB3_9GAMM|nr:tetratricopeptide repeat protein [Legionella steigerwaltii]KTD80933.1 photosystem I assembly protein Ycf3 [Legionella steigerwaltii]STY23379.1 photosystem I assembly protein Ycf3 [Legionella steigerwaltii]
MFHSLHIQGVEAFKKGEYIHAKKLFLQAISLNHEIPDTYFLLGQTCFLSDEKNEAISYLNRFIELTMNKKNRDNWSYAFELLGQCYAADNQDEVAITYYFAAIENDFNCVSARHNLGLSYMKLAQNYLKSHLNNCFILLRDAQIALTSALALCRDNPMLLHSVASWHEQCIDLLNQLAEEKNTQEDISVNFICAIHYYREALAHCHKDDHSLHQMITENLTECYAQFGHHLYQNKEYTIAQILYSLTLDLDKNHIPALNQMGICSFKQGMYMEARKTFVTILERTVDIQDRADAWLNIACCYRLEKNWGEAENSLAEARKLAPQDLRVNEETEKLKQARSNALLGVNTQTIFGIKPDNTPSFSVEETDILQPINSIPGIQDFL